MSQSTLNTVLLAVLAAATSAIAVNTLVGRGAFEAFTRPNSVKDWRPLADSSTVVMEGDGSMTIIEFSDFQCPFCARAQPILRALADKYPGEVTLVYRHFPLPGHKHAFAAAMASECASEQGAFRQFHDLLFERQDSIGLVDWSGFAERAGVPDLREFASCVADERYRNRVERDRSLAEQLAIPGTPGFILNGKRLQGVKPLEEFEKLLR